MKAMAVLAGVAALAAGLAACSSSPSSATSTTSPKTGTETAVGRIGGPAVLSSNPTFHLTMSGPVATSGTIPLGGAPKKGAAHTFTTGQGKLAVVLNSSGTTSSGLKSPSTCEFAFTTKVPFTVNGAKSTGKFSGASGNGRALVVISGNLPKMSNGKCNVSSNARPSPKTTVGTFTATMNLTVRH